ncbi:MAG: DUF2156 domain-containing protein [Clostridia bacterium]|nr:DUF2156 domain-containing protein [Clostridia bacterium]
MEFHSPTLKDAQWVHKAFDAEQTDCCEYCFGNIYMWSQIYDNRICDDNGIFVSADFTDKPVFCYPIGDGDKTATINKLIEYSKDNNITLEFFGLTEKDKDELNFLFPEKFEIIEDRDSFDYLYTSESLANLSGRKLASKRNHISYFERTFDWKYEPITKENINQCAILNEHWEKLNREKNPEEIGDENTAIKIALDNYFDLGFEGGLLTIQGEAVAFTFGERLNNNTFCTHVEKAYGNIRGAYQMINREFARQLKDRYEFINREEDTGSEGLRRAKLSYHPHRLVIKYSAIYKD